MLLFGLEPDDIARPDFFDGAAPSLYPAEPWSRDVSRKALIRLV